MTGTRPAPTHGHRSGRSGRSASGPGMSASGPWMRPLPALIRTWPGRRAGDPAAVLRGLARGHTAAVGVRLRGRHALLLLDPELVGEFLVDHARHSRKGPGLQRARVLLGDGLLTAEEPAHSRARRLIAPAFAPNRIDSYVGTFTAQAAARAAGWQDGARIDLYPEMTALTLSAVGQTLLGHDLSARTDLVRGALGAELAEFAAERPLARWRRRRPGAARSTPAAAELHRLVDDIVTEHRASITADPQPDAVTALLSARSAQDGQNMLSDKEIHDHVLTLMLAGHETTAAALTWALDLISRHRPVQARLQAELDTLGEQPPTAADLPRLGYTRAVVAEAMRLYPPAWVIGRSTTTEIRLNGWTLPPDTVVLVSPLLLHRDPRWFRDPDAFDPGRWLDERHREIPAHAYLPFGTGPRVCIGEQFAWNEAVAVLATLARSWTVRALAPSPPEPEHDITLRPSGPVPVQVRRRGSHRGSS